MKRSLVLVLAMALLAPGVVAVPAPTGSLKIAGIAFVDTTVTSMGARAKLPANARVLPPGVTVTGAEGCPTNRYGTDGAIVAVLDYDGPPTSASLTVNEHSAASNGFGGRPPYYIDLNAGRTLQFLGPIRDNGVYDIVVEWGYAGPSRSKISASFTLNRSCPNPR